MRMRTYRTFQALVLALLGFYLLDKLGADEIRFYINPRFILLSLVAALTLFALAQRVLFNRPAELLPEGPASPVNRWTAICLLLMVLPVSADLAYQALPYQVKYRSVSGLNDGVPLPPGGKIPVFPGSQKPEERSILDWVWLVNKVQTPAILTGEAADVTGFVHHVSNSPDQFYVVRFVISNNEADLQPIGMIVAFPQSTSFLDNQWVRVQGNVQVDDAGLKINARTVQLVPDPRSPYLSP
jgi:uncharacterized repeat protein (TIGR03943 family)